MDATLTRDGLAAPVHGATRELFIKESLLHCTAVVPDTWPPTLPQSPTKVDRRVTYRHLARRYLMEDKEKAWSVLSGGKACMLRRTPNDVPPILGLGRHLPLPGLRDSTLLLDDGGEPELILLLFVRRVGRGEWDIRRDPVLVPVRHVR